MLNMVLWAIPKIVRKPTNYFLRGIPNSVLTYLNSDIFPIQSIVLSMVCKDTALGLLNTVKFKARFCGFLLKYLRNKGSDQKVLNNLQMSIVFILY